jgi:RNA polymerase sigma factor (TIGR02999 family)
MADDIVDQTFPEGQFPAEPVRSLDPIEGARCGDTASINELINTVYPELKRRARWLMTGERPGHTFGPSGSELVQRVMERILAAGGQIFSAAKTEEDLINLLTRRMRFILVDYARAAGAHGRPSPRSRVPFDDVQRSAPVSPVNIEEVLQTDELLTRLAEQDPEAANALELRFFAGLTNEEAASAMGLSVASFRRTLKRATVFIKTAIEHQA